MYIDSNLKRKNSERGSKFKTSNHVRISKYKDIFAKVDVSKWSEKVIVIKKVETTVP